MRARQPSTAVSTLTHLYNSGYCEDSLVKARQAADKLMNSLSNEPYINPLVAIDAEGTLLRVDLRHYGWTEDVWDATVAQNSFAVEFEGEFVDDLKARTDTNVPFQPLDALLQITTRGDLYYQIMRIPATVEALEQQLNVRDPDGVFNVGEIVRAGFEESGVSDWNRIIERRRIPLSSEQAYWRSYDFLDNTGLADIFANPIFFEEVGGEIIYSLPNGLHAYMLIDEFGGRINEAPTQVVKDPKQRDSIVKNGISCMSCHEAGIIPKADEVREFYVNNKNLFPDKDERKLIEDLYLPSSEMNPLQLQDIGHYIGALGKIGVGEADGEPIIEMSLAFESNVDLVRAAAEFGVSPARLDQNLAKLSPSLQKLRTGSVSREVFEAEFRGAVCLLLPGEDILPVCP